MTIEVDPGVLVVGAGPTGLAAAIELARHGTPVRIIDRKAGPTALSKAVGIAARSLELLEPSGVTERLLARGRRLTHIRFHHADREIAALDFGQLRHRFAFLLCLPQHETEVIMADVLAGLGIEVQRQTELVGLRQAGDGVLVELVGPDGRAIIRVGCVFGADGIHSRVREQAGLRFEGHQHERRWSIADVVLEDWPFDPHAGHAFLHANGDIGFVIPIGERRWRAVSNTEDAMSRIGGRRAREHVVQRDVFELPVRQSASYQAGSVYIGGDAAHVHSPVGARGMNLGIEDAAAFARRFEAGELAGYTAERRPPGRDWIRFSERLLGAAQEHRPLRIRLRNAGLRLVGHLPMLQRRIVSRVSGLAR